MTEKQLIDKLIESKVTLNYGKSDYPLSISYAGNVLDDIEALRPEIMKIRRTQWENVRVFLCGKDITDEIKPITYKSKE